MVPGAVGFFIIRYAHTVFSGGVRGILGRRVWVKMAGGLSPGPPTGPYLCWAQITGEVSHSVGDGRLPFQACVPRLGLHSMDRESSPHLYNTVPQGMELVAAPQDMLIWIL